MTAVALAKGHVRTPKPRDLPAVVEVVEEVSRPRSGMRSGGGCGRCQRPGRRSGRSRRSGLGPRRTSPSSRLAAASVGRRRCSRNRRGCSTRGWTTSCWDGSCTRSSRWWSGPRSGRSRCPGPRCHGFLGDLDRVDGAKRVPDRVKGGGSLLKQGSGPGRGSAPGRQNLAGDDREGGSHHGVDEGDHAGGGGVVVWIGSYFKGRVST